MATTSEVEICNMALSHIGQSSIESLSEKSAAADECATWFDFARRVSLEVLDWPFARKRVALGLDSDPAPEGEWTFRYKLPTDCVAFREIQNPAGPQADKVPFELESSADNSIVTILTDAENAIGIYTFDQMEVARFSPGFIDTLSYQLAHRIAFALTGKRKIKEDMLTQYFGAATAASGRAGNQRGPREPRDADYIRARD